MQDWCKTIFVKSGRDTVLCNTTWSVASPPLSYSLVFCSWKRSRIQEIYWKKNQRIINQVYTVLRTIFFSWYFHMIFFFTFAICAFTIIHLFYFFTPAFLSIIPTGYNRSSKDKSLAISHTKSGRGSGFLLCRGSRWVSQLINIASFPISLPCEQFLFCSKICERVIVSLRNRRAGRQGQ